MKDVNHTTRRHWLAQAGAAGWLLAGDMPVRAAEPWPTKPVKIIVPFNAGGATDTVSSFVYREYRERSNVGYGTMIAEVYLIIIIIFISLLLRFVSRWMQRDEAA